MLESEQFKVDVFDYITDRAATYYLGSAIRCIVIGIFGGRNKVDDINGAIFYLQECIDKELEYIMHDIENCEYSVRKLAKSYGLSVNLECALLNIDAALDCGMSFETDKVREQLNYAIARLTDELNEITHAKGE